MKIAIIGSGISGLSAGWFLKNEHNITLFERESRFGGHANTSTINYNGTEINVDTGFIVFNCQTYYHLQKLFAALKVDVLKSNMSFGVSNSEIEYSSTSPFGNLKNIINQKYLKMLFEIFRFNKIAKKIKANEIQKLEEYLNSLGFSEYFCQNYIYPMASAIWSCHIDEAKEYPAKSFIDFFKSHGLLQIMNHPRWYCVKGGSKEYVSKITQCKEIDFIQAKVSKVENFDNKVKVFYENKEAVFDKVIIATHADEAFEITGNNILKGFEYSKNYAVLHKNKAFMPKNKKVWASWNYISDSSRNFCLTYWMNNLQQISKNYELFVTLNPKEAITKTDIFYENIYFHPIFNAKAYEIQKQIAKIQGSNNIYYVGSYLGYGFHEDGIKSSYDICKTLIQKMPW